MEDNKKILGFIPARGGSKGLPNKNIKPLNNKPLIAYTIEAAVNAQICDKVIVDTDSQEIAEVSESYGAEIPYLRPDYLGGDDTVMMDVISHAMDWFDSNHQDFDLFLYLQPTSPLRNARDITGVWDVYNQKDANTVISVNEAESTPERMAQLPSDYNMEVFRNKKNINANRQELGKYYELNGAVHLAEWQVLKSQKTWYVEKSLAYVMNRLNAIDIDDEVDFEFVDFLFKQGYVNV